MVEIKGNYFYSEQYLKRNYKEFKDISQVKGLIKKILADYNNAGFAFCKIKPEIISQDSASKVILWIEEGERIEIIDYLFKIAGKTERSQLRRIARLKLNTLFSLKELNRVKNIFKKTGIFKKINEQIIKRDDDYYLLFEMEEEKGDYILGIGSLAQNNANLSLGVSTLNFFGTMRRFEFNFESSFSQDENYKPKRLFAIDFTDPVLLTPVTFKGRIFLDTRDTARFNLLEARFIAPLTNYFSTVLLSGVEMVSYFSEYPIKSYNSTLLGVGIEFNYESERFSTNQKMDYDYLIRENERYRIKYDGEINFLNISLRPHYSYAETKKFEDFDYFRLGGAKTIRGYWEDEFLTKSFILLNIEYRRFPLYPILDIAFFNKMCYYSYGFGIDARADFGIATLVFAWPKKGRIYDGKVHLLLGKNF
uniref:POTRA domain-containing protein n=1 Tax=candidate division WOR-3 bacterium TaxID=2052148 RepID=A0A7C4TC15_UNCW3